MIPRIPTPQKRIISLSIQYSFILVNDQNGWIPMLNSDMKSNSKIIIHRMTIHLLYFQIRRGKTLWKSGGSIRFSLTRS